MDLYGATEKDFAHVKVKNSRHGVSNPKARFKKIYTEEDVLGSPYVSQPLRLFDICATSDGGAALVITSMEFAKKHGVSNPVRISGVSTISPTFLRR